MEAELPCAQPVIGATAISIRIKNKCAFINEEMILVIAAGRLIPFDIHIFLKL
jgi:hypothetical protein